VTALFLYDDARARRFEPFALTRPASELRAGAEIIRKRWMCALELPVAAFIGAPHLADFDELDAPRAATGVIPAGTVIASSRFAPTLAPTTADADAWRCDGRVAAVRLGADTSVESLADGSLTLESLVAPGAAETTIAGWWMHEVWDLVRHLVTMLAADAAAIAARLERAVPSGLTTIGDHDVVIERGAHVEPMVLFDASAGPILVRTGARVSAFTRLVGPCVIGEDAIVAGGRIAACSVGEQCRVHGELSTTIFIGHANKAHDGFVGHSVIGRWANLGASTVTSNLKNTYGSVSLWTPDGQRDTGMQFLGSMIGDHAKTAIGTRLTTGSVIGVGANVFGSGITPKVVPPFAWGADQGAEPYALEKVLEVAERVMSRRHVALGEAGRRALAAAYAARWSAR
jgi:UDP-N-acetylglucosamine diphosphorylase/glucosamine-1-phosphate N-acetyltransferase